MIVFLRPIGLLITFLKGSPVLYHVIPTVKDFIKTKFEITEYPVNQVIGRDGKYFINSEASGIGIKTILQQQANEWLSYRPLFLIR